MSLPVESPSYPIADFDRILHDQYQLDLSPLEIAEILWLAVQRGKEYVAQESRLLLKVDDNAEQGENRSSIGKI
jgi:hypothetical protein